MKNSISSNVKINIAWSISSNLAILRTFTFISSLRTEIGDAIYSHQVAVKDLNYFKIKKNFHYFGISICHFENLISSVLIPDMTLIM